MRSAWTSILLAAALGGAGCTCGEKDDPTPADADTDTDTDTGSETDTGTGSETDTDTETGTGTGTETGTEDPCPGDDPICEPADDDYLPREGDPDDAPYADCIADDDTYHAFNPGSISTIARIAAFEAIADQLWRSAAQPPDSAAFQEAASQYALPEGIESRVTRREDEHYPCVSDGAGGCLQCRNLTADELAANCDRCVGPCSIQPLVRDALDAGIAGEEALLSSARIEAGLIWFLYQSVYKECATCAAAQGDCDSCWAYYTGGLQRDEDVLSLADIFQGLEAETFDRAFDGVLAIDCWDDLDDASLPARDDLALRDLALAQLDRGLLRGMALILRDRIETWDGLPAGAEKDAAWEFISIIGPVLQREAEARDAAIAGRLEDAWTSGGAVDDVPALICDLETAFHCP